MTIKQRHLAATIGAAVIATISYVVFAAVYADRLPSRMATHFNLGGRADGFMTTPVALIVSGIAAAAMPLLLIVIAAASRWWEGRVAPAVSGVCVGLAVSMAVLGGALVLVNADLTDPADARLGWLGVFVPIAAGVLAGFVVGAFLPRAQPVDPEVVPALDLPEGQRAAWFGRAEFHPALQIALSVILVGAVVFVALVADGALAWVLSGVVVLAVAIALACMTFVVQVDSRGLRWRSALGFPRGRVPIEDIETAEVIDVRPMDYGGWGLRFTPGATAIVTRSGPALAVRRTGRDFVITLDDPRTPAAVLNAEIARTTPRPEPKPHTGGQLTQ
ncbi:DUF1648 domain-containing protein [Epidermidibacterium keratini]|uniref:DUF1648 domain-containing protein n=1 Tax=Epidermidibacterium keratini TaxID=1891644 RepID=A0A7L4YPN9_9ACTN|nr:DUF1648 domain-containing protein [Epidermidibacterium keratini]QHC00769.1 DUF1648 domain-containing protein [Epidermidibacterium keratini]